MQVADFLQPGDVLVDLDAQSKLSALQLLSRRAATALGVSEQAIFDPLYAREKLGSTGLGEGAAIPHTRVAGLEKPFGLLARLMKPIDFDAIDEIPVDILFLLLLPAAGGKDHLNVLAAVARQLRSPDMLKKLRHADRADALYVAIAGLPPA